MTDMKITDGRGELSRLVEDPGGASADDSWAVDLLRATPPYRAPAGRKQRVQLSLGQSAARRAPLLLRPAIVAGVLIGCGAFASAALGHWPGWMARAYQRLVPSTAVATAPLPDVHAPARGHRALVGELAETEPTPAPALAPPVSRDTVVPPRPHRAPAVAAAGGEETSIVLEAMRALRLERNPVRARVLLARYLDRHPTGTLAEEALAMSIEAAVAHHDADAGALGARYLRLYPSGPFRALARQTQL